MSSDIGQDAHHSEQEDLNMTGQDVEMDDDHTPVGSGGIKSEDALEASTEAAVKSGDDLGGALSDEDGTDMRSNRSLGYAETIGLMQGHVDASTASSQPSSDANSKKRKRTDTPKSRAVSPPWKLPTIEGPTTFTQEGKRRSARTNELPIDLKPGADKRRHTRAEHQKAQEKQHARKASSTNNLASSPKASNARVAAAPATFKAPAKPQQQPQTRQTRQTSDVQPQSPTMSRGSSNNSQITYAKRHRHSDAPSSLESTHRRIKSGHSIRDVATPAKSVAKPLLTSDIASTPPSSGFKLRLRGLREANREPPRTLNALHMIDPDKVKHASFSAFIKEDDPWEGEDERPMTDKQAARTARSISRLLKEAQPGGLLSEERSQILSQPQPSDEPPEQYGHWQHVVAHAVNFQKLLSRELKSHQEAARRSAIAAKAALDEDRRFAKLKPKISREEWEAQQHTHQLRRYQQVVRDVQGSWGIVHKEVLKKLEKEQEVRRQKEGREALDTMLDQSTALLNQRRGRNSMSAGSDEDDEDYITPRTSHSRDISASRAPSRLSNASTPAGIVDDDEDSGEAAVEDVDENMSSSDEEEEEHEAAVNPDDGLSAEELRAKYDNLPEEEDSSDVEDHDEQGESEADGSISKDKDGEEFGQDVAVAPHREGSIDVSKVELDEVDADLEESEDEESGSETEPDSDDDDETGATEDDEAATEEESHDGGGMLGFFGKSAVAKLRQDAAKAEQEAVDAEGQVEQAAEDGMDMDPAVAATAVEDAAADVVVNPKPEPGEMDGLLGSPAPNAKRNDSTIDVISGAATLASVVGDAGGVPTPAATSIADADTPKAEMMEAAASTPVYPGDADMQATNELTVETDATSRSETPKRLSVRSASPLSASRPMTPKSAQSGQIDVSLLLRGNLREYQQNGLDWLAGLYSAGSNGILADEMGLGKTIQTIALFAHLAIHQKQWGPHLVVVPTSVMLNWEMEFKKFLPGFKVLTYYGNINERRRLRQGWLNPDKWNVVITSYQLVVQDKQAFKKRPWHYLVLDEAHQIKNWQTQKWQSMLNMNTQARLLLTGTPLQNNLSELWSLFFFLMPGEGAGGQGFAELEQFQQAMKRPADQILNQGKQVLDESARQQVKKLHEVLRPYLLRRLKADVEKQMPGKYEHVVYCKLSKRQRQLYDAFLGRADTRATLTGGSYVGVMHVLMELRKVCNHPDLFEERMVRTSFCMPRSAIAAYEPVDVLVRKRLLASEDERVSLEHLGLNFVRKESSSKQTALKIEHLQANRPMAELIERATRLLGGQESPHIESLDSTQSYFTRRAQVQGLEQLKSYQQINARRTSSVHRPLYGISLRNRVTVNKQRRPFPQSKMIYIYDKKELPKEHHHHFDRLRPTSPELSIDRLRISPAERTQSAQASIQRFSIATPNVVAYDVLNLTLGHEAVLAAETMRATYLANNFIPSPAPLASSKLPFEYRPVGGVEAKPDPFHEARIRQTIAFPDKRLLQYDCGKLQKLARLLRDLQSGGHRALIFTQMSRVLDILEIFLNFHGYRYLRLDGTTKVEQRQVLTERYNSDPRILVFILSSRSGGLGINLTGADSVIFYDLDWNPAMDKQCQDRAHRIGQTRDVHIYKFVSEYTIEANILRKSNQKRLLDDVIIQEGEFTTDYFNRVTHKDALEGMLDEDDETSKAMDLVLGSSNEKNMATALQSVEETEDATAAAAAAKEAQDAEAADEKDMGDRDEEQIEADARDLEKLSQRDKEVEWRHVDEYMFNAMYKELEPQAEGLFKVKARDKAAARRAKDRHRVR